MSRQSLQKPHFGRKSFTSPRLVALLTSLMMPEKSGKRDSTLVLTGKF